MSVLNVDVVDCTYCEELIEPAVDDGVNAFDCQACGNGWHHYDNCASSCSAYLDELNADDALSAALDERDL